MRKITFEEYLEAIDPDIDCLQFKQIYQDAYLEM